MFKNNKASLFANCLNVVALIVSIIALVGSIWTNNESNKVLRQIEQLQQEQSLDQLLPKNPGMAPLSPYEPPTQLGVWLTVQAGSNVWETLSHGVQEWYPTYTSAERDAVVARGVTGLRLDLSRMPHGAWYGLVHDLDDVPPGLRFVYLPESDDAGIASH